MSLKDFDVVIFAGGKGERLKSAWDGPKCLAPVGGRPFIFYILDQVFQAGAENVVVALSHRADEVEEALSDYYTLEKYDSSDARLACSRDDGAGGEAGALKAALEFAQHDKLLTLNGDTYVYAYFAQLALEFVEARCASMCLDRYDGKCSGAVFYRADLALIGVGPRRHTRDALFYDIGTPERYAAAESALRRFGALP